MHPLPVSTNCHISETLMNFKEEPLACVPQRRNLNLRDVCAFAALMTKLLLNIEEENNIYNESKSKVKIFECCGVYFESN